MKFCNSGTDSYNSTRLFEFTVKSRLKTYWKLWHNYSWQRACAGPMQHALQKVINGKNILRVSQNLVVRYYKSNKYHEIAA